jgi:DNA-binding MarR family transcriptional regulator
MKSSDAAAPAAAPAPGPDPTTDAAGRRIYVGALLRLSWQRVRARIDGAVRAAGFDDLQETHMLVFSYPPPDGVRPSELARRLGMSRQAANHLIGQMEAMGYLKRRAAPGGQRRLVYLTARAWRVADVIFASLRDIEAEWAREVGKERFAEFLSVLRTLALKR